MAETRKLSRGHEAKLKVAHGLSKSPPPRARDGITEAIEAACLLRQDAGLNNKLARESDELFGFVADALQSNAREGRLEAQLRAQAGHLQELQRCVARLQAQVAGLERGVAKETLLARGGHG